VLALRDQILPPTINLENRTLRPRTWTSFPTKPARQNRIRDVDSFGFGGTNGALLFRRWDGG